MRTRHFLAVAAAAPLTIATPALAAPGDPVKVSDNLTIDPIIDARLRYEGVNQPATDADAVTLRLRAGAEFRVNRFALLAEGEGSLAIVDHYNAFPFVVPNNQRRPQYSTVGDPMTIELNRLQLQYKGKDATVTVGRQRINIDDQRWVGAGAWRQNEQTFDAVRGEAKLGPVSVDGIYANSVRTVYGIDAGPRESYDGDFFLGNAVVTVGGIAARGFAYVLDYDEAVVFANSSVTLGGKVTAPLPLSKAVSLNLMGSYARQKDHGSNPVDYAADYFALEAALAFHGLTLTAGWENLGTDAGAANGAGRAVQMPLATLHRFNGWADIFTTTPNKGLEDFYVTAAYKFAKVKALPGLNAAVTWHRYKSDVGGIDYGKEWNGSIGFKLGRYAFLAKYANYDAEDFGVDTEKMWLQVEVGY